MEHVEVFRDRQLVNVGENLTRSLPLGTSARQSSYRLSRIKGFGVCQYGERGSIGDAELVIDMVQVDLHGAFGELEPLRYFLVGQTFGHHPDDLTFARGEEVNLIRSYLGHFFKGCSMPCSS